MNNKKTMWVVLGVIVLAGLVWWAVSYNNMHKNQETSVTPTPVAPAPEPTPTSPSPTSSAANASYNQALAKYGSNRIQIQPNCQASPNNVVYKNNTAIMLDNRSNATHVVKVNGKTFTMAPYAYNITTLSSAKLPLTILVDCDKSQNVATILLEK